MNKEEKKRMYYEKNHKEIEGIIYKHCSKHNEYFPDEEDEWFPCNLEYFYKNNSSSDGLYPYCKRCNIRKSVQYNRDNMEWHNKYSTEYIKNDYVKERRKGYVKDHRYHDKFLEWQQNNKDKLREYRLNREQNKTHTISKKEWESCKEYFNNTCAYCGLPIDKHYNMYRGEMKLTDFHKEHVNHEGSNDLSNCIPSCKSCNSSKGTLVLEEWYARQDFYNDERLDKIYRWLDKDYKLYIQEHKPKRKYTQKDDIHIENTSNIDV
jgi:hypothetical protein